MFIESHQLVYPEGEVQEIEHPLPFNQIVGLNGEPLQLPLPTHRMIVYRVYKISRDVKKGETVHSYHLELVKGDELFSLTRRG